jgi:hypothetical protein
MRSIPYAEALAQDKRWKEDGGDQPDNTSTSPSPLSALSDRDSCPVTIKVPSERLRALCQPKHNTSVPPSKAISDRDKSPPPTGPILAQTSSMAAENLQAAPNASRQTHSSTGPDELTTATVHRKPPKSASKSTAAWYSPSYLSANSTVSIEPWLRFTLQVVKPGEKHCFPVDGSATRVCSVAAGRARVRVGCEPEFLVGPHGVFTIMPSVAVVVENRLYVDAVIHVTSVAPK